MSFAFITPPTQVFSQIAENLEQGQTGPQMAPSALSRTALMASTSTVPLSDEIFNDLREGIRMSRERIRRQGDHSDRVEAARRQEIARADALLSLWNDPEIGVGAQIALQQSVSDPHNTRSALEQEYVNTVADSSTLDPNLPEVFSEILTEAGDRSPFEVARDREVNRSIWLNQVDQVFETREDRAWGWGAFELFGLQNIPFRNSLMQSGLFADEGEVQGFIDNIFAGGAVREESALFHEVLDRLTPEQFSIFAEGFAGAIQERATQLGYTDLTMTQQLMEDLFDAPPAALTNTFNALDNVPIVGSMAVKGVRAGSNLVSTLNRTGGRRLAADAAANALEVARREGIDEGLDTIGSAERGDLIGNLSPDATNLYGSNTTVPLGETVDARLEAARASFRELLGPEGITPTTRLNPEELERAASRATQRLEQITENRPLHDVSVNEIELADGSTVREVSGLVGRPDGIGFASSRGARRYASEMGFTADDVIQDESGQWFVKAVVPVRETGFYHSEVAMNSSNSLSRTLLSGWMNTDQRLRQAAVAGGGTRQRITRNVIREYERRIASTPRRDRNATAHIWQQGNNEARWYTRNEFDAQYEAFTGRGNSDRAWNLYQETQRFNDIDYMIRRDALFKELHTQGYETVSARSAGVNMERLNGRISSRVEPSEAVYDIESGRLMGRGTVTEAPSDNHVFVRLQEPVETAQGDRTRIIMGRRSDFTFEPLRRDQLAYRPGGHRMPQGNYFVKQAQRALQSNGDELLLAARTYIAADTVAEARAWTKVMEEARQLIRSANEDYDDLDLIRNLNELLEGRRGFPTGAELLEDAKAGRMNLDDPFEVLEDRALPSAYRAKGDVRQEHMYDANEAADGAWARTHGSMYYGRRGEETLKDWQGNQAPTLDMYGVMNRSLNNIASLTSYGDYKLQAVSRWNQTYRKFMDVREGASDMEALMKGTPIDGIDPVIRNSMEELRTRIQRTLGHPTRSQRETRQLQRQFAAFVNGDDPNSWRNSVSSKMLEWWNDQNPVSALKGMAFDLKLGMFNIAQFPLQISTMIAATSLSPKHGAQGMLNFPFARLYLAGNERVLKHAENLGIHKSIGMEVDEYREYMRSLRRSGYLDVGGNHSMMEDYGPGLAYDSFQTGLGKVRENARFFFNEAETWNRLTSSHIAWKETTENFPGLAHDSAEFQQAWLRRASDYSFAMDRESSAAWQQGIAAIPTQFWSYSARMMEAMVGKQFTAQQKLRLVLGQSLFYGSAGIPLVGLGQFAAEQMGLLEPDGTSPELYTVEGFYERGLFDHLVHMGTGMNLQVGERVGVSGMMEQVIREFMGQGEYGETSTLEFLGGASTSIWFDLGGDVLDVFKYLGAEMGQGEMPQTRDAFIRLGNNISTFSNTYKAYMIARYGLYLSSSQTVLASEIPDEYAFATMLGVPPGEILEISEGMNYLEHRKELIDETAALMSRYRSLMVAEPHRALEHYADMRAATGLVEADIRQAAQRQVGDEWIPDLATRITRNVEQRQLQQQIAEEAETEE